MSEQSIIPVYWWEFNMLVILRKNLAPPNQTENMNIYTWSFMPKHTLYKALQLGLIYKNSYVMPDDSKSINTRLGK